jgi:hypothetical protein
VEDAATGKPCLKRGSAKSEREARKAVTRVAALKDAHRLPAASASRSTVADLLRTYLAAKKLEASAKTYTKEEQFAALHIIPALGHIKQEKRTPAHVRTLMTTLAAEGLAPETIKGVRGTLARALDQAVIDDILPRNVARLERKKRTRRTAREKQANGEIVDRYRDHDLIFCSAFFGGLCRLEHRRWSTRFVEPRTNAPRTNTLWIWRHCLEGLRKLPACVIVASGPAAESGQSIAPSGHHDNGVTHLVHRCQRGGRPIPFSRRKCHRCGRASSSYAPNHHCRERGDVGLADRRRRA